MFLAVKDNFENADIVVKSAAVADFTPVSTAEEKIKKSNTDFGEIKLKRTEDIIGYLGEHKRKGQFICGFSMETENMLENSRKKLTKKNMDMIVANNLKTQGAGFGTDTNVVTIITEDEEKSLPIMSKKEVAHSILSETLGKYRR